MAVPGWERFFNKLKAGNARGVHYEHIYALLKHPFSLELINLDKMLQLLSSIVLTSLSSFNIYLLRMAWASLAYAPVWFTWKTSIMDPDSIYGWDISDDNLSPQH